MLPPKALALNPETESLELPFYQRTVLSNGLRVLTAAMPQTHSVSVSLYVGAGSRYERDSEAGVSHFVEHLLFKGTEKLPTAKDVAEAIDGVGGVLNGGTDREYTVYYIKVARPHMDLALDVLFELVRHPLMDPSRDGEGAPGDPGGAGDGRGLAAAARRPAPGLADVARQPARPRRRGHERVGQRHRPRDGARLPGAAVRTEQHLDLRGGQHRTRGGRGGDRVRAGRLAARQAGRLDPRAEQQRHALGREVQDDRAGAPQSRRARPAANPPGPPRAFVPFGRTRRRHVFSALHGAARKARARLRRPQLLRALPRRRRLQRLHRSGPEERGRGGRGRPRRTPPPSRRRPDDGES